LAWRVQENAFDGHDKATLKLLEASGQKRTGDERCRRLKTGTVLIRDFGGSRHTVTIVPEGFYLAGEDLSQPDRHRPYHHRD
jgi:hypothetical protein